MPRANPLWIAILAATIILSAARLAAQERQLTAKPKAKAPAAAVASPKRVALVIGAGAYQHVSPLANPANDADGMAEVLRAAGFDVIPKTNPALREMSDAVDDFARKSQNAEVAFFYFSGHGLQVDGENYLIPVDAAITGEGDVAYLCYPAGRALAKMEDAQSGVNVMILDACRDNPFSRGFRRGGTRGLAVMRATRGTLIAYSTSPGTVAADGSGQHSPYTASLLQRLPIPGESILDSLTAVRRDVMAATENKQVPWEATSLTDRFFLVPPGAGNEGEQLTAERLRLEAEKTRLDSEKLEQEKMQVANLAFDNAKTYDAGGALPTEKQKRWTEYLDAYGARYQGDFARERIAHWKKAAQGPQPGQTRALNLGGGVTMDLVWVPGGSFQMGSQQTPEEIVSKYGGKPEFFKDERPVHTVTISGFWMGKCEATNAQYRRCQPSHSSKEYNGHTLNEDNQPVVYVSWNDAKAFCEWLSRETAEAVRLPREAEWEYACRAGTTTARYWGDDDATMGQYANVADRTARQAFPEWSKAFQQFNTDFVDTSDGYAATAPVGSLKRNAFGLYDMIGNVYEWCEDWYGEDYYGQSSRSNPEGPSSGQYRVLRGGSWVSDPCYCRSSKRNGYVPVSSYNFCGFRVVCVSGGLK